MEIQIKSHTTDESYYVPITKITPIATNPLIIAVVTESIINNEKCPFYEFFPVLFVGAFQVGTSYTENYIGYFFHDPEGQLQVYSPSDVDGGKEYIYNEYDCKLINYDGYSKLCELTGEKKLSLIDYISNQDEMAKPNTAVKYKNDILYGDKMSKLYKDFPN